MHRGVNGDSNHQFNNEAPALCLTLALPQSQGSLRAVLAISLAFRLPASPHPARAVRPVPGPVRRLALLVGMGCQRNKKEGGKAGDLSLLRTQPLPPAPTRLALCKRTFSPHHSPRAAGSLGAWHNSVPEYRGTRGGRGALAPAEAGERKATARQLHSIKCGSRAKVRRRGTASPKREQKCPVPAQPCADHRGVGRRKET